jgi:methionyl-tRNA formyltransferase
MIDALGYPYSGASTFDGEMKIVIDSAQEVDDVKCALRHCGKIIFIHDGMPTVICGEGLLKITAARCLQADGSWASYLPVKRFRVWFK